MSSAAMRAAADILLATAIGAIGAVALVAWWSA